MCTYLRWKRTPFAILLGDDLVVNEGKPALLQLVDAFNLKNTSIIGVQKVEHKDVYKYGIVTPSREVKEDKRLFKIVDMVEKPAVNKAPSDFAVLEDTSLHRDIRYIRKHRTRCQW